MPRRIDPFDADGNPEDPNYGRTRGQRVLTAVDVEAEIVRISSIITAELDRLVSAAERRAHAEHGYEVASAKAVLVAATSEGSGRNGLTTVDEREALARVETSDLFLARLIADAHYDTARIKIRAMESQLSALQTIAANVRSAITAGRS